MSRGIPSEVLGRYWLKNAPVITLFSYCGHDPRDFSFQTGLRDHEMDDCILLLSHIDFVAISRWCE